MTIDKQQTSALELPDITAVLEKYSMAWKQSKAEGIAQCWEPERFILYKAEEVESVFHDWEQVLQYWRNNEALIKGISLRFSDVQVKTPSDGLIVATTRMRWDIRFSDDASLLGGLAGKAMGGDNHVVVFLCPSHDEWKICGWCETPDAAMTYMRALYLKNADMEQLA